jgi:SEC-C motif domain protein
MTLENNCLCGSGAAYVTCCGLYHTGEKIPPSAEALMRSRFTAYAMHNSVYLKATWESHQCPAEIDFSKETAHWQRLEIISIKKGGIHDDKGLVEFKAYYLLDGTEYVMHELSRFKKVAGRWFYVEGLVKSIRKTNEPLLEGKNALCQCGSGKKFKRCCGK